MLPFKCGVHQVWCFQPRVSSRGCFLDERCLLPLNSLGNADTQSEQTRFRTPLRELRSVLAIDACMFVWKDDARETAEDKQNTKTNFTLSHNSHGVPHCGDSRKADHWHAARDLFIVRVNRGRDSHNNLKSHGEYSGRHAERR